MVILNYDDDEKATANKTLKKRKTSNENND